MSATQNSKNTESSPFSSLPYPINLQLHETLPFGVNLIALPTRLVITCRWRGICQHKSRLEEAFSTYLTQPQGITNDLIGHVRIEMPYEVQSLFGRLDAEGLKYTEDGGSKRERNHFDGHTSGFNYDVA